MCTASWDWEDSACLLWFSRDERRSRAIAQPPRLHQSASTQFLSPIDPDGGGTWIWINSHGLAACLLNDYSAETPSPRSRFQSRGKLMLALANSATSAAFEQTLLRLWQITQFQGCHLLLFARDNTPQHWHCQRGKSPLAQNLPSQGIFTSSSWQEAQVRQARQQRFAHLMSAKPAEAEFERLHRDRDPLGPSWSILMDRELSTTHSLSHLRLAQDGASFRYQARQGNLSAEAARQAPVAEFAPASSLKIQL